MKRKKFIPIVPAVTLFVGLFLATTVAAAAGPCCLFCQKGRCDVDVDIDEVEIKGFDVECEAICIPPLRFPWECGPLKKCGQVRCVKKLVGAKKTVKVCTYDWEAIICCPDCRLKLRCCGSSCGNGSCCGNGNDCEILGCDAPRLPTCDSSGCCAAGGSPAAEMVAQLAAVADAYTVADEPQVAEVIVADLGDVAVPEVTAALVHAIGQAQPDTAGWVRVTNLSSSSLSAEGDLIE